MKILYVITGLRFGGAEKLLYSTCKWLRQRHNCSLEIAYFDPIAPMLPLFDSIEVRTRQLPYGLKSLFTIAKRVRNGEFDIVHTHLIHADVLGRLAVLMSGNPFGVAIISTAHGTDWFRWKRGLFCTAVRMLDRLLSLPTNSTIVSVSKSVKKMLIEKEKISPAKLTVLYNALEIPARRIKGNKKGDTNQRLAYLYVGRLSWEKNVTCLLRSISELSDLNVHLTIAGTGAQEAELKQHAKSLALSDRITFQAPTMNTKELYVSHDILVLPSIYEGLSMVILEAFSYGLPVIGSNVDGIAELLAGDRGLLFKSDDHLDLARCLRQLYQDKKMRTWFGQRGYTYVKQHHDIKDYVDELHAVYQESLIKSGQKSSPLIESGWIL